MRYTEMQSPIGRLTVAGDDKGLRHILFSTGRSAGQAEPDWERDDEALQPVVDQLEAYFEGRLRNFELELAPEGTDFQRSVWLALADIPYGQTTSYGELAAHLGRPAASRAVGAANGANPLPIVLPCHRVIGADGSLTGFGGGLPTKRRLLEHEQQHGGQPSLFAANG
jgi:methylated-DNA-[protein]-cysteine S-methyltransferase